MHPGEQKLIQPTKCNKHVEKYILWYIAWFGQCCKRKTFINVKL